MSRKYYGYICFLIILLSSIVLISYNKENKSPNTFSLDEFKAAMSEKGYEFEIQDAEKDFLQATRKRMIIDDIEIDMYLFHSDKDMEEEAAYVESNGYGYDNGKIMLRVSWVNKPHFYKKGSLVIQYVGENQNIISSLEEILGYQFAGF